MSQNMIKAIKIFLFSLLVNFSVIDQTFTQTASILPLGRTQYFDNNGNPTGNFTQEEINKYEEELNKALILSIEIEILLEKSKLSEEVKNKWIKLISKNGRPYLG